MTANIPSKALPGRRVALSGAVPTEVARIGHSQPFQPKK